MISLTAVNLCDRERGRYGMFFMGGMTLGYLHPPAPAKAADGATATKGEEKDLRSALPANPPHEGSIERTLLWARRILC